MLWPGMKKLGKELELKRTDSEIVGKVKNCYVKMYDGQNMKILELLVPELSDTDKEYIESKLTENKVNKYEWLEYGVRIIFNEYVIPYSTKKIKDILIDFTDHFSEAYPDHTPRCQKCEVSKDLEAYHIGGATRFICNDCYESAEKEIGEIALEQEHAPPNYLMGFLGALLFSIPGVLVTVVLFVFLNRLAAISAVLYVLLGIMGYKKFKGKISQYGVLIIIASTLIMVAVGIVVSYSVMILQLIIKETGSIDIAGLLYFLSIPEVQREIIQNLVTSYIVSGLYLVFQVFQMMKEWKPETTLKKARYI